MSTLTFYHTYHACVNVITISTTQKKFVNVSTENGNLKYDHPDTDKFLRSIELPKYAHAHLLTSILGPDYVDVKGDGVTEDDLGYWVKFTYQRTTSSYKWRDPFSNAHYQQGWKYNFRDDKGSFVYGEKELWHLAQAMFWAPDRRAICSPRSAGGVVGFFLPSPSC